jgi:hypothetical protein
MMVLAVATHWKGCGALLWSRTYVRMVHLL